MHAVVAWCASMLMGAAPAPVLTLDAVVTMATGPSAGSLGARAVPWVGARVGVDGLLGTGSPGPLVLGADLLIEAVRITQGEETGFRSTGLRAEPRLRFGHVWGNHAGALELWGASSFHGGILWREVRPSIGTAVTHAMPDAGVRVAAVANLRLQRVRVGAELGCGYGTTTPEVLARLAIGVDFR